MSEPVHTRRLQAHPSPWSQVATETQLAGYQLVSLTGSGREKIRSEFFLKWLLNSTSIMTNDFHDNNKLKPKLKRIHYIGHAGLHSVLKWKDIAWQHSLTHSAFLCITIRDINTDMTWLISLVIQYVNQYSGTHTSTMWDITCYNFSKRVILIANLW